jgi:hypothetical protein
MRATEARLTLAIVSLRNGDIDGAVDWARKAFSTDRKSINSLSMVTDELYHQARASLWARRELDGSDVYRLWSRRRCRVHGANRQQPQMGPSRSAQVVVINSAA